MLFKGTSINCNVYQDCYTYNLGRIIEHLGIFYFGYSNESLTETWFSVREFQSGDKYFTTL